MKLTDIVSEIKRIKESSDIWRDCDLKILAENETQFLSAKYEIKESQAMFIVMISIYESLKDYDFL